MTYAEGIKGRAGQGNEGNGKERKGKETNRERGMNSGKRLSMCSHQHLSFITLYEHVCPSMLSAK